MFTNDLLKAKRILITGGGTGIGRAMAERFLQLGATVYICGRRNEVVEKTAQELSASTGGTIEGFAVSTCAIPKMLSRSSRSYGRRARSTCW